MTVPTESDAEWLDDGHTARVRLQDRTLVAEILCPHDARDLTALPIGDVPACRRDADEYDDAGNLVGPGPVQDRCVLAEIASTWQGDELWAPDTADFEVRASPFPVRWRGRDQDDIEIKPAPVVLPDQAAREWGRRFWDGTAGPEESRETALATAARFKPGYVEVVHRDGPHAEWVRATDQPHTSAERIDAVADHVEFLRRINHWRGQRLVELGEHPNPPKGWAVAEPSAPGSLLDVVRRQRVLGPHPAPGQDEPTHPGPEAQCTDPACVKSRARHEAAAEIQDLTAELFRDDAVGGAR